ncbi:MAG TPA: hypothetical protein VF047_03565 [Nitrososphaeraceae archaeon]|jgi:hypothetical protein
MPQMNGNELATKLLENNIKLILMSTYTDIECDPNFQIINKPITISQLLQIVKDITSIHITYISLFKIKIHPATG